MAKKLNIAAVIREIEREQMKKDIPDFRPGDIVRVHIKVREGDRERTQVFEGIVLARRHGGIRETFVVRKVVQGVGVERIFPLHSPLVEKIEVVARAKTRRAKVYFVRNMSQKEIRRRLKYTR